MKDAVRQRAADGARIEPKGLLAGVRGEEIADECRGIDSTSVEELESGVAAAPGVTEAGDGDEPGGETAAGMVIGCQVVRHARLERTHVRRRQGGAGRQLFRRQAVEEQELPHEEYRVHRRDLAVG